MKNRRLFSFVTAVIMIFSLCTFLPVKVSVPFEASAATDVSNLNPVDSTYSLIKSLEGCDLNCFWDVKQWTIGYGNKCPYTHTSNGTSWHQRGGHSISESEARALFSDKLSGYVNTLKSNCKGLSMTQNQFDALLSATYNHGNVNNCPLKYYLQGKLTESEARQKYYVWCINAGTKDEKGLRNRRKKEADVFFSDPEKKWYDDYEPVNLGESFCAFIKNSVTGGHLQNDGWNVAAYAGTGTYEQAWVFNRLNDGSYTITSLLDINNLTVYNHEDANCASLIVTTDDFDDSQRWFIYNTDKGYIFRPSYSDRVMDLDNGDYDAGTNIQLYDYNGTISQYFNIKVTKWYDLLQPAYLGTDIFYVSNNNTTGGYINNEGWNVAAHSGTDDKEQIWYFKRQDDGSYIISSALDSARLSPYNSEDNNSTSIIVTHDDVNSAQKWFIYHTNKGYIFRPSYSDKVMDIAGGRYESGTNIQLYEFNCTYAQFFSLRKVDYSYKVYDTVPEIPKLSINKKLFSIDEEVKITFDPVENVDYYFMSLYRNGELYINEGINTTITQKLPAGDYIAYVSANNSLGNAGTDSVSFKVIKFGDCNDDGELTVSDAVILQKWLLSVPDAKLDNWESADMNDDGVIDIFDMVLMRQALIKK